MGRTLFLHNADLVSVSREPAQSPNRRCLNAHAHCQPSCLSSRTTFTRFLVLAHSGARVGGAAMHIAVALLLTVWIAQNLRKSG